CASATVTFQPRPAASMAAVRPLTPAPTIVMTGVTAPPPLSGARLRKGARNPGKVPGYFAGMDPKLVAAAQHGDAFALDELLDELAPYVRRLCWAIAPAVAEDAAQEALHCPWRLRGGGR